MPPQNSESVSTPKSITTTDQKCAWYEPLCKVTPLSKYLALLIFILLPFVGGYVGYQIGIQDCEQILPVNVENTPTPVAVIPESFTNISPFTPPVYVFPYSNMAAKFAKAQNVIRYVADPTKERVVEADAIPFDYFTNYREVADVGYGDQMAANVSASPYLFLVASTTDYMIFSAPLFKETEGSESGLYKYDVRTRVLSTMETSKRYHPIMTDGKVSPDHTKLALVNDPYPPVGGLSAAGIQLGYIDLGADTYTDLKTLDVDKTARFCIQEMGCGSEIAWKSDLLLEVKVTDWTKCQSQFIEAKDTGGAEYSLNNCSGPALKSETVTIVVE
jgi:hypothetical protein